MMLKRCLFSACALLLFASTVLAAGNARDHAMCQRIFAATEKAGAAITSKQVEDFLAVFDTRCLAGAESHEWANELLFAVLLARPKDVMITFAAKTPAARVAILRELESPVHDGIDLRAVWRATSRAPGDQKVKRKLLEALKSAASKIDLALE